jgi:hypothetical protein
LVLPGDVLLLTADPDGRATVAVTLSGAVQASLQPVDGPMTTSADAVDGAEAALFPAPEEPVKEAPS